MLDKNILILIIPLILVVTISGVPITNSGADDPAKPSNTSENTVASSPKPDAPTKDKENTTSVIAIKVPPEEKKGTPRPMLFIHSVGKTTTTTEAPTPSTEPPTPASTTKPEEDSNSTPRPMLVLYSIPNTTTTSTTTTTTTSTTTAAPSTSTSTKPTTPSTDDEPQTNDTSRPKSWIKPNNPPSPDETVKRPENFLRDYDCPKRKGFFPYPDKCDVYIECKDYIPLTYICPDGLYFNPDATDQEDVCDDPSEVDCETEPDEEPDSTESPTGVPSNILRGYTCPKTHGFFSYPGKCDVYIMCEQDTPLTYICPEGLQFNPNAWRSEHVCDHPSVVTCENREQRPSKVRPVDTRPTLELTRQPWSDMDDFSCPTPNGYFKLTEQCDEYVECRGYTPLRYICPDGLHFKTDAQWTEYPCTHPMLSQCS